jgi:hypothetical protein
MVSAAALVVTLDLLARASAPIAAVDVANAQVAHVFASLDGRVQTALFRPAATVMEAVHLLTLAFVSQDGRAINAKRKSNALLPIARVMVSVLMESVNVNQDMPALDVT